MAEKEIKCQGFTFLADFDSANLARVEFVPRNPAGAHGSTTSKQRRKSTLSKNNQNQKKTKPVEFPDYEFNLWTNPDCSGTEFQNNNRTWFHFGITGGTVFSLVKLNIIDLNKQSKMYSQGMAPVYKVVPGKCQWERIHDKPVFTSEDNIFSLSFKFRTPDDVNAITYFAFTYPFSYSDLQTYLGNIDLKMSKQENHIPKQEIKYSKGLKISNSVDDAIYYHRETLCYSLEKRSIDLLTISSHHNITSEREPRLQNLFPLENIPRPFKFQGKKVVFMSARVHPGETPSSFVMNGIINLLIQKNDPIAILLRRQFLFKLIPMLNPDGVARGHYRTDTRGCNLNRFYLNPSLDCHPSIYGARALIRYHHYNEEVEELKSEKYDVSSQADPTELSESELSSQELESPKPVECKNDGIFESQESVMTSLAERTQLTLDLIQNKFFSGVKSLSSNSSVKTLSSKPSDDSLVEKDAVPMNFDEEYRMAKEEKTNVKAEAEVNLKNLQKSKNSIDSGIFLYMDMHGHASKKGVFIYGNHFDKVEDSVECMLFPKIMSVNSQNFHFPSCNFTEKNMYLRDKRDGTSREGSGRVAVLRLTGLIRSYTLECNYNTGRLVNKLPQCCRDLPGKSSTNLIAPPKYSPAVYEEIGRSLCVSLLDMTNSNPWSRIPNSEYHTLFGLRDWLRIKTVSESFLYHKPLPKTLGRTKPPNKASQTQVMMGLLRSSDVKPGKLLSNVLVTPLHSKTTAMCQQTQEESDRKENMSFRGTSSALMCNRKEPGPSHAKRAMSRVASVLQVRSVASMGIKPLNKTMYRGDKKFKQFGQKSEGNEEGESSGEGDRRSKMTISDQCLFKQSPKRLKISKGDEGSKIKMADWSKEDAVPGPSNLSDLIAYSKLNRSNPGELRGVGKSKQQISPVKFKKSLEKRRGSDASRKKSKTLFKKGGKIIMTNDASKNLIDRKRRKNLGESR